MKNTTIDFAKATPVVSVSPAYSLGDLIGTKLTLAGPGYGIVESIILVDQANQKSAIDVVFFQSNPTATTFTDNGALDIDDTDMLRIIGTVSILAANYISLADNAVATIQCNLPYYLNPDGQNGAISLYACLVARGTPTYVATTDVQIGVGIVGSN